MDGLDCKIVSTDKYCQHWDEAIYKLTSDDLWPWYVAFWTQEHVNLHYVTFINQVWFQSDLNISNETKFYKKQKELFTK